MLSKLNATAIINGKLFKNAAVLNSGKKFSTLPAHEPNEPKIVTKEIPGNFEL